MDNVTLNKAGSKQPGILVDRTDKNDVSVHGSRITGGNTEALKLSEVRDSDILIDRSELGSSGGMSRIYHSDVLWNSNLLFTDSSLTGGERGIERGISVGTEAEEGSLITLDNTTISGVKNAGIFVTRLTNSSLNILNGSAITAGNGVVVSPTYDATINILDSELNVGLVTKNQTTGVLIRGENTTLNIDNSKISTGGSFIMGTFGLHLSGSNELDVNITNSDITGDVYIQLANNSVANVNDTKLNGYLLFRDADSNKVKLTHSQILGGVDFSYTQSEAGKPHNNNTVSFDGSHLEGPIRHYSTGSEWVRTPDTDIQDSQVKVVKPEDDKVVLSNSANAALSSLAAPLASWNSQTSAVYERMSDRLIADEGGVWGSYYGNEWAGEAGLSSTFNQKINGMAIGADKTLPLNNARLTLGAAVMHDDSRLSGFDEKGSGGSMSSTAIQGYARLAMDNGLFFKATASAGLASSRLHAKSSDGSVAKGDYKQNLFGLTGQAGYRYQLTEEMYVMPYAQMNGYTASGANFSLDNGMQVKSDRYWSARGELGVEAGFSTSLGGIAVTPHLMVAGGHEFVKDNNVHLNGISKGFNNTVDGSGYRAGAGIDARLTESLSAGVNVSYSRSEDVEQRYGINAGVRYSF